LEAGNYYGSRQLGCTLAQAPTRAKKIGTCKVRLPNILYERGAGSFVECDWPQFKSLVARHWKVCLCTTGACSTLWFDASIVVHPIGGDIAVLMTTNTHGVESLTSVERNFTLPDVFFLVAPTRDSASI
jgi:hypothetical protein